MQSLFVGHGSPVTAFTENRFQKTWNDIPGWLKKRPKAIVVLSAHWLTSGVFLTGDDEPKTIHDFRGFPNEYYQFNYPAKGAKGLSDQLVSAIPDVQVSFDWGFDHGTWAILKHVFPEAEVPVVQMSINIGYSLNPVYDQPNAAGKINDAKIWTVELAYGVTLSFWDK